MTYQLPDHGIDRHMTLNHMVHAILTSHLPPLLMKTSEGGDYVRTTNQASNAHQSSPEDTAFWSVAKLNQDLGPVAHYGRSKPAATLYSRYMTRHVHDKCPKILTYATHPGVVKTKMSRDDIHKPYPRAGFAMSKGLQTFKKDQFEGVLSKLYAATVIEKSGDYTCPPATPESGSDLAQDQQLAEQLMKLTNEAVVEKLPGEKVEP